MLVRVVSCSDLDEATRNLWSHPRLLNLVSSIIGPEIGGNPVWNLRSKTPETALTTVPWHQDIAYLCPGAEATPQPTAWIPLLDVNEQNGTLKLIRGGTSQWAERPNNFATLSREYSTWCVVSPTTSSRPGRGLYGLCHLKRESSQAQTVTQSSTLQDPKMSRRAIQQAGMPTNDFRIIAILVSNANDSCVYGRLENHDCSIDFSHEQVRVDEDLPTGEVVTADMYSVTCCFLAT